MIYYTTVDNNSTGMRHYNNGYSPTGTTSVHEYFDQFPTICTTSTWVPYTQTGTAYPYTQTGTAYPYTQTGTAYPYTQTGTAYPYTQTGTAYPYTQTGTAYPYTQTGAQTKWAQCIVDYKPSEQELSRYREKRVKAEEVAKKAREEAEEAARKARLLLAEYLDNENMKRLLNKEPLEVSSRLFGDIKYQIPISNGRIKARKENNVVTELCLVVKESGQLPMDDIILAKLLHVLHDEENMLRTANHFNTKENLLARLN